MPKEAQFVVGDDEENEIEDLKENGQLSKSTRLRRKGNVGRFSKYIVTYKKTTLDELIANALESKEGRKKLENALMGFFNSLRVVDAEGKFLRPMNNTCEGYRSHIKMYIMEKTEDKLNIYSKGEFGEFMVIFLQLLLLFLSGQFSKKCKTLFRIL